MRILALTSACLLAFSTPVLADPAVGLGLSFSFGGGQSQTGIGLRVFSDDEEDSFAASAGLDYIFGSGAWRGTVGGAYLGDNSYVGLDVGLNFNGGGVNYGISAGAVNTEDKAAPAVTPPPGPPPV
ncbi:hypothetical protein G5B31_02010 [Rhodobacter sp. SGA-6-6]|uniref:hypothetical protein n=1 Tax=Rhodobacter sp. SGA-6-6 TaxID=2710882 RepID=UPI0013ED65A6|nr:hypothetical protein [Rhodobacter sp. SGA-6-6]NGM44307.1 hypothetical protein [Rhodobacter sp. SGA-6-6]